MVFNRYGARQNIHGLWVYPPECFEKYIECIKKGMDIQGEEIQRICKVPYATAYAHFHNWGPEKLKVWNSAKRVAFEKCKRIAYHKTRAIANPREYFIQETDTDGRIKVGWTGQYTDKRYSYYADNSHDKVLLGIVPNRSRRDHDETIKRLDATGHKIKGEWYTVDILGIVNQMLGLEEKLA